ncbi:methyl-accepting chemotaxis protein [Nisaea sp.]|uniref:methyl-accepting chemotaxis protein n=1 Tax=Nisaea sp. TaxID=2024842 RepID=UPI0032ECB124
MKLKQQFLIPSTIVLLLGMGALSWVSYVTTKAAITNQTMKQMDQAASSVAQAADVWFLDRRRDLAGWAQDSIYGKATESGFLAKQMLRKAGETLENIKHSYNYYEAISLTDLEGKVIASSLPETVGSSIAGTDFLNAALAGDIVLYDSHRSELSGEPVIVTAAPVSTVDKRTKEATVTGVLFSIISLSDFTERFVAPAVSSESGRVMIFNSKGQAIVHPQAEKALALKLDELVPSVGANDTSVEFDELGTKRLGTIQNAAELSWRVLADEAESMLLKPANDQGLITLGISLIVLLVVGGTIYIIVSRTISPLRQLTTTMGVLAGGDTEVVIPSTDRKDELGEMAQAVGVFKNNAIEVARLEIEQRAAKERAEADRIRSMNELADRFETSIGHVVETVSSEAASVEQTAQSMTVLAGQAMQQSETVAHSAQSATENVQNVAASTEELSSSISEISRQVAQSNSLSSEAVVQADQTNTRVESLATAAAEIGEVVMLIQGIAEQTNLLALNATIEAARAGEAGKGFAVVASEVKSLANQTAKATEDIGSKISDIQSATTEAVTDIKKIGQMISNLNEIANGVAAAVEEQSAATQEIAGNIQQASAGTQEVSGAIAQVTDATGQTGTSSSEVLVASEKLRGEADKLNKEISQFLTSIRAG